MVLKFIALNSLQQGKKLKNCIFFLYAGKNDLKHDMNIIDIISIELKKELGIFLFQ